VAEYPTGDMLLSALRDARPRASAAVPAAGDPAAVALLARIMTQERPPTGGRPARPTRALSRRARPLLLMAASCLAVGALVAGVLAGTGALGSGGTAPEAGRPGAGQASAGRSETAVQLLARMGAAAASISDDVIYVRTDLGRGYTQDAWYGPGNAPVRLRTYGPDGRLRYDVAETARLIIVVDYADRAWWTYPNIPSPVLSVLSCGAPRCIVIKPGTRGGNGIPLSPAMIRSLVRDHSYQISGTGTIHGQRADELVPRRASQGSAGTQLWVSVADFLPLRFVSGSSYLGDGLQTDTYYLAATQASLARFQFAIPDGFSHRSAP
jgi:hypothetical protein